MSEPMNESQFEAEVKQLARTYSWRYYHTWRSKRSPKGFPDCVMVRRPRVIFAELKSEKGVVSKEQAEWLDDLRNCGGIECYLWRPSDFYEIATVLQHER